MRISVTLLILAACLPAGAVDELIGLWGSRVVIPPAYRGSISITELDDGVHELCVDGRCDRWRWDEVEGDTHRFELSDVGTVVTQRDGTTHWIQPPASTYQGWATPIRMEQIGKRRGGTVEPYEERRTFYLKVQRQEDDSIYAFVRNPERNFGNGMFDRIALDGRRITFLNEEGEVVTEGRLAEDGQSLTMNMFWYGTVEMQRLDEGAAAIGFDTRTRHAGAPRMQRPWPDEDWEVADIDAVGLDVAPITALFERIANFEIPHVYAAAVHALLVARDGKLVFEEYFAGYDASMPHDTRSAGKSIGAVLAGAIGVDPKTKLCDSVDWAEKQCEADPRRARITLEHLITMSPGIACDDDDMESPGNEGAMQNQSEQPDWYRYILDVPMAHEPGEHDAYCSAGINLSGAILSAEGGAEVYQLFDRYLARPLGIEHYHMNLDPVGHGYLGGGIRLRPRDMLKFGELMRTGGLWKGERILPEAWVEASTAPHSSLNEENDYGYAWWRQTIEVEGRPVETYYASGNGGQMLFVIPEFDMTVLFMGGNYGNYGTWRHFRDLYLADYILKAALPSEAEK